MISAGNLMLLCGLQKDELHKVLENVYSSRGDFMHQCTSVTTHLYIAEEDLSKNEYHDVKHIKSKQCLCVHCDVQFSSHMELINHQIVHLGKMRAVPCHDIGYQLRHGKIRMVHCNKVIEYQYQQCHQTICTMYKCSICQKVLDNKFKCPFHRGTYTPESSLLMQVAQVHVCQICRNTFLSQERLKAHLTLHTEEKRFICGVCSRKFKTGSSLAMHRCGVFECDVCCKTFTSNNHLTTHQRTHTGQKPFICDHCGKGFSYRSSRNLHTKIHMDNKPFLCSLCGQEFVQKIALVTHQRKHTGERPYLCDFCGKDFANALCLTHHKRTHTGEKPYICHICSRAFIQSSSLTFHIRKHTGEKNFQCDICGKCFIFRNDMKKHMRIHSGERPYTCTICGKTFVQSSTLHVHCRKQHNWVKEQQTLSSHLVLCT